MPEDTTIVTPNSDTPLSPWTEVGKRQYISFQFTDTYTANFAYAGTRTTGNGPSCFMVAGPGWSGEKPPGITRLFRCETEFAAVLIRTQLFDSADIDNVKKIQAGYCAEPLSTFLNKPSPPEVNWPKINKQMAEKGPFGYPNFVLQFWPPTGSAAVEAPLRAPGCELLQSSGTSCAITRVSTTSARRERPRVAGSSPAVTIVGRAGARIHGERPGQTGHDDKKDWANPRNHA